MSSKTNTITAVLVVGLGLGTWAAMTKPWLGRGDIGHLTKLARYFTEDIQFKDFKRSSMYHHALERDRVDIGHAIEKLFLLKPELLDIQTFKVRRAEIDSTGRRGKTIVRARFRRLNITQKPEEKDLILYWIKRHPDCPVGGSCVAGQCQDSAGKVQRHRKENKHRLRGEARRAESNVDDDSDQKPYVCEVTKKDQWYMNLDSTLKDKKYH